MKKKALAYLCKGDVIVFGLEGDLLSKLLSGSLKNLANVQDQTVLSNSNWESTMT